jgi:hypothetical protein
MLEGPDGVGWRGARCVAFLAAMAGMLAGCAEAASTEPGSQEFERPKPGSGQRPVGGGEALCGDGIVEGEESCDRKNFAERTCQTEGYASGELRCTLDCRVDTTDCDGCGNGVADPGEECDGEDLGGMASCADLNAGGEDAPLLCTDQCLFDLSWCGGCGDGTITAPEQCEPETETMKGNLGGKTCETLGWDGGDLVCNAGCRFDESGCHACGDGSRNGPEACDGLDLGGKQCSDMVDSTGKPFAAGSLGCTSTCELDTSGCSRCGDGILSEGEDCDGEAMGGKTCAGLGYVSGSLSCTSDCRMDESGCDMLENPIVRCNEPERWIPDNYYEGITDTIVVPQGRTVADVDVRLKVAHEWVGDLVVELRHGATVRKLVDRVGVPATEFGCDQDDIDATLDDEGSGLVEDGCTYWKPSVAGNLIPNESLSAFDGQDMGGNWSLRAADMEGQYQGKLVEWCVVVTWQ